MPNSRPYSLLRASLIAQARLPLLPLERLLHNYEYVASEEGSGRSPRRCVARLSLVEDFWPASSAERLTPNR
jgi:hypothetical protein